MLKFYQFEMLDLKKVLGFPDAGFYNYFESCIQWRHFTEIDRKHKIELNNSLTLTFIQHKI